MQRRVLARTTSSGSGSAGVPVPAMDLRVRLETPWLPRLLAERAVTSVLQPIINLESGARVGVEALMRGNLDGEERSALEILEAARAHELLFTMDVVAWTAALDQGLPRLGPDERLHVNLLPTAVDEPDTYLATTQALARRDDLARVVVEIAEADGAETRMSAIADGHRALGARVALDRACGGLRTLRHIDTIRPDMVKLDMGLTLGLTPDDARVPVVRAIVEQARAAGALTVAVGIESAAACLTLRELGVDLGQGYFLGRPQ